MADIKELTVGGTTYKIKDEVCRTNILYSLQTGVKNIFDFENANFSDINTMSIKTKDSIAVSSRSGGGWCRSYTSVELKAGSYVFATNITNYSVDAGAITNIYIAANTGGSPHIGQLHFTDNGVYSISFDIQTDGTYYILYYTNDTATSGLASSYVAAYNMICTKAAWDQEPNVYRPFARSNYDLTVREQQDRNALVEVIDEGSKNKALTDSFTIDTSGGYVTNLKADLVAGEQYVISFKTTAPSSGTLLIGFKNSSGTPILDINITINDGVGVTTFTCPSGFSYYNVQSYSGVGTYSDFMICTEADWKISQNYAPFALPNTDLTRMMTPFFTVPINHNMIYRGANLGDTLTADQDTALSSGNFTDLYLGDYWTKQITIPAFYEVTTAEPADWSTNYTSYYTKSGDTYTPVSGDTAPTWAANTYYERLVPAQTVTLKAVIADFDTFYAGYASGSAAINTHHAAVIVTGFSNVVWNKTNSTAGGYVASLIHKWLVGSALPQIETWFGSAKVLSHQKLLTNAITGDAASGWAWSSQKIALLSENQMYGSKVWGGSKATNGGYEPGEAFKHLNVFNHIDANLLFGNKNIWLRDIASAVWAAHLNDGGGANGNVASATRIAPAALILLS